MGHEKIRYKVAARSAPDFSDEFFVSCPKCQGCAILIPIGESAAVEQRVSKQTGGEQVSGEQKQRDQSPQASLNPKHLECSQCQFRRSWNPDIPSHFRALVNWFGELALYMQVDCGDQTVWALNPSHLEFLEEQLRQWAEQQTEPAAPLHEWLEHRSPADIADCLARLKRQPVSV